jgi:hypothetical protein
VPHRHTDGGERGYRDQRPENVPTPPPRIHDGGQEERHSERGDGHPLENAERARFETEPELRVVGVAEQTRTRQCAQKVDQTTVV